MSPNPFEQLNASELRMIFGYLDWRSVMEFALVDRLSCELALDYGEFHLNLSDRKLNEELFVVITNQRRFASLVVTGPIASSAMSQVIFTNPRLKCLELKQMEIEADQFQRMLELPHLQNLVMQEVTIHGLPAEGLQLLLPRLKTLAILSEIEVTVGFGSLFMGCQLLNFVELEAPNLDPFVALLAQLPNLKTLKLRGRGNPVNFQTTASSLKKVLINGVQLLDIEQIFEGQEEIEVLEIIHSGMDRIPTHLEFQAMRLFKRLVSLNSLKSLTLDVGYMDFVPLFFGTRNGDMKSMTLVHCAIDFSGMSAFTTAYPQLENIHFYDCVGWSNFKLGSLVKLAELKIHFSDEVGFQEAVDYAVSIKEVVPEVNLSVSVRNEVINAAFYS